MRTPIRCAVVGYGAAHNFGRAHGRWIESVPHLKWTAVCDHDSDRLRAAVEEFPELETYAGLDELLAKADVDMVSIVTPHFLHAPMTVACAEAGKHVVVDKAMCLSVAEADAMIEAAGRNGVMLAVFHNRRSDGNYRAIKEAVRAGRIGRIFHIEVSGGGYRPPLTGWYGRSAQSGGLLYYWGPHAVDWVLDLVGHDTGIRAVTGFYHKLAWMDSEQEEQARAVILFENGCTADIVYSHIAAAGKPLWRILGSRGGILDSGRGAMSGYMQETDARPEGVFELTSVGSDGKKTTDTVPYMASAWSDYYRRVADHLLLGGRVPVTGEEGRRVVAVLEAAGRSARSGKSELTPY